MVAYTRLIQAVVELNLTYVCNPSNWDAGGHGYNNVGQIIGCEASAKPIGNIVAYEDVADLRWENATLSQLRSAQKLQEDTVYRIPARDGCVPDGRGFQRSYRWYRSQFHAVRLQNVERLKDLCWKKLGAANMTKVAVAVRRGDDPKRGYNVSTYKRLLDDLFGGGIPGVRGLEKESTYIAIISEAPENASEMLPFREYPHAGFVFSQACTGFGEGAADCDLTADEEASAGRRDLRCKDVCLRQVAKDLDCMATSDVLLTSHGSFSRLATALQDPGLSVVQFRDFTGSYGGSVKVLPRRYFST